MTFLKSFFSESPGVGSMTRLVHWWAFVVCIASPIALWALLSWHARVLLPIDSTISTFCTVSFGAATAGKILQAFAEAKTPPTT